MRKPLVTGNWKMYTKPSTAGKLAGEMKSRFGNCEWADLVVCPPFTSIMTVLTALQGSRIEIGAQNLHWEKEGAYTGEVSGEMIRDTGCRWVIIGHSERRTYFGETDEKVLKKIRAALDSGLKPIVCVGETLEQRDLGITEDIVSNQIRSGLGNISDLAEITIAYEPVWAIGTGRTASPEQAEEVHKLLRILISDKWGKDIADSVRILYGGSVKPDNSRSLWEKGDIDGFLVGGASLKPDSFGAIVDSVK